MSIYESEIKRILPYNKQSTCFIHYCIDNFRFKIESIEIISTACMFCPYPSQNLVKAQYQQEAMVLMMYQAIRAAFEVRGQRTNVNLLHFISF